MNDEPNSGEDKNPAGLEMIIGIYGIIKAGGAYVPVDPEYPQERIDFILENCNAKAVLTYKSNIKTEKPVLDLADPKLCEGVPKENPERLNKPQDLIYVIYTSGTTGKPKGVMIEHKGVINFCHHSILQPLVSEFKKKCEYVYASNKIVFDITVEEIFIPLLNGLGIVIARDSMLFNEKGIKNIGLVSKIGRAHV